MLGRKSKAMRLPGEFLREILDHAHEGSPNEICGLIAGRDGQAVKLYRTTNDDPNPRVKFNVDPMDLLEALREMEEKGWHLLSIYHSHPASEAYPSGTDVGLCHYDNAVYIIVSLAYQSPQVRAYTIDGDRVTEVDLIIDEDGVPMRTA